MTPQATLASPAPPVPTTFTDRHEPGRSAGLASHELMPPWALEMAPQLSYSEAIAALSAVPQLPKSRDMSTDQVNALVAVGLAHLGYPGVRDLDDRLCQLNRQSISNGPGSVPAERAVLRVWGSYAHQQRAADLAYQLLHERRRNANATIRD